MMLLSAITILVIGNSLITSVYAQEEGNAKYSNDSRFFAIQHAQSGSISEINSTTYSLELNDVSDKTILFSDRPERIVTSVSTSNYIGNWTIGEDSLAVDAPNAVLIVDEVGKQDVTVVELFNPVYDSTRKTLNYDIIPENSTSIKLPKEFALSTIIIDLYRTPTA